MATRGGVDFTIATPGGVLAVADEVGFTPDRRLMAFTNEGESQAGLSEHAPWLLETRLRDSGARVAVSEAWGPHVIVDGNLFTGQNPASSELVTRRLLEMLAAKT